MPDKWTVLRSERIIDNWPYHRTRRDRCRLPNGDELDYFVHEHSEWVNAVVLTPGKEIVLVRQYRHGVGDVVLEIPGGMAEEGEPPASAIVREVAEETGYRAPSSPIFLGRFWSNPAIATNGVSSYLLTEAVPAGPLRPDRTEDLERVLMPLGVFSERLARGDIPHLFSALAYYRAQDYLGRMGRS